MASIQKRTTKAGTASYRVGYRHEGKLRWTHSVDTPEAALFMKNLFETKGVELALATIASRLGRDIDDGPPLLSEAMDRHLAVVASYATPGTVEDYRKMAGRSWLERLGGMPVDEITSDLVAEWIAWQRRQETFRSARSRAKAEREGRPLPEPAFWAPKSITNAQGFLSDVLDYAVSKEWVTSNVAAGARIPDDAEPEEMIFLTPGEFARLLASIRPHWQPLVAFMAGTGARWGEATALRPADFDLDADQPVVRINRAWKRGERGAYYLGMPKSRKALRTVTLPEDLVAMIRPTVVDADADQYVFHGVRGGMAQNAYFHVRIWQPAVAAAGLDRRPRIHDLRHSHASWLIAAGVPLPVIQRRLGHESITTTVDRYGHLAPDAHWGAAEATGAALAGALPQIEG